VTRRHKLPGYLSLIEELKGRLLGSVGQRLLQSKNLYPWWLWNQKQGRQMT
jgi:hypothetical protein